MAGIVVGLGFRAPALLAASAAAALAGIAAGIDGGLGAGWTVLFALACVVTLQAGYLIGLAGGPMLRRRD